MPRIFHRHVPVLKAASIPPHILPNPYYIPHPLNVKERFSRSPSLRQGGFLVVLGQVLHVRARSTNKCDAHLTLVLAREGVESRDVKPFYIQTACDTGVVEK